jgi:riboflavin transporter FmnP
MSRWVVLERRVGAVTSQRVLKVLFYVNILPCFFVVEHFTANAVSDSENLNTSIGNIISR